MPYIFYDTETTGTETAFDQILQFAAIKTDDNLNELDSFNIRCRIQPYAVPSPEALLVTGVRPALLIDKNLPSHYEAIRLIRAKLMAWSPATFIGYNSIDFDENLLRQALFQTLHPAYLTNTKGNARADVMRIAIAASTYAPGAISVPEDAKGKQTFKLDRLAPANGFQHDDAHEAMADVRATIYVASLLRDKAPDVWGAMSRATRKNDALEYIQSLPVLSLTERSFGRCNSWLVAACGVNQDNSGQVAVFDLAYNPDEYLDLTVGTLINVLNAKTKVIRTVRANAQPIIMPAASAPVTTKALAIPQNELQRRAGVIAANPEFQSRISEALSKRYADKEPPAHVEERIYDGFPCDEDNVLMEKFHLASWPDRLGLIKKFKDERVIEFSRRLIYSDQPAVLPESHSAKLKAWAAERVMTADDVPWMTVPKALAELAELDEQADEADRELLAEIKTYIDGVAARFE
jgi:exodeoxyribonuclease-1